MRKITNYILACTLFSALSFTFAFGQATYNWAEKGGGTDADVTNDVTVDRFGNTIAIGTFRGSATFGSTTLTAAGNDDIFVVKYDSSGAILWAKGAGGTEGDFAYGVTTDLTGNVYVTGYLSTFGTLNPADFDGISASGPGDLNVFVAKYNSGGTIQWVQTYGGTGNFFQNIGFDIEADQNGNTFVTGAYTGLFEPGSFSLNSPLSESFFVMKLDGSGNPIWIKEAGGSNTGSDRGNSIFYNGNSTLFIAGQFADTVNFGSTTLIPSGGSDAFFVKMDTSGSYDFAVKGGGSAFDRSNGIAADDNGDVYVTGLFSGGFTMGSFNLSSSVAQGIFLGKLDANGSPVWLREPTSLGSTSSNEGLGVVADPSGNGAIFTGYFQDTLQLGSSVYFAPQGGTSGFAVRYNSTGGSVLWSKQSGTTISACDMQGNNVVVCGSFSGTQVFDGITLVSSGNPEDAFVAHLDQNVVGLDQLFVDGKMELFPNPASHQAQVRFELRTAGNLRVSVRDLSGREVMRVTDLEFTGGYQEHTMDVSSLKTGLYFVEIASGASNAVFKLVVAN